MIEPEIQRYFDILGLTPTASEAEIREARNFVTKAFHPDKYAAGSKDQARAHQKQVEINHAYEQLLQWVRDNHGVPGQDLLTGAPAHIPGNEPVSSVWRQRFGVNKRQRVASTIKIAVTVFVLVEWIFTIAGWIPGTPVHRSADPVENTIMLALLALSTLGLVWFIFAPEAKHLVEKWFKL